MVNAANFPCRTDGEFPPKGRCGITASATAVGPIIGYTRDVVAFEGRPDGGWISIVSYDSPVIVWIDGATIKPVQPAYPGQHCIVTVDVAQRPIFQIY